MIAKTVVIEDIKKISLREFRIHKPENKQLLIKIHQCNICTADWQLWAGMRKSLGIKFPTAPGHDIAGEVIEVGSDVSGLKVGDHVAGFGPSSCGECYYCHVGYSSKCLKRDTWDLRNSITGSFGMSQYVLTTSDRVYKVSKDLPYEEACYLEPLATAVHGVRKLEISPIDDVLVIGAGNLGLINAQAARAFGSNVIVSEINEKRCKVSRALGFCTVNPRVDDVVEATKEFSEGKGIDAVVLAVGSTEANEQAMKVLGSMGKILFFAAGYPAPKLNADPNLIHYEEYELIGSYRADQIDFKIAAKLLSKGTVKTGKLISRKISINDAQHAFELAATPGNYRVSLSMWE